MPTINLITLGCPKNTVDSERMHHLLKLNGYDLSDDAENADIIVVNTCGFIEPAKEESIATVMDAAEYKKTDAVAASSSRAAWPSDTEKNWKPNSSKQT